VVDRKKAIIITSGGKNIAPSEIENAIQGQPSSCAKRSWWARARSILGGLHADRLTTPSAAGPPSATWQYTTYKSLTQLPKCIELVQGS
jgi:long-chain acyl-CoA synthetase